MRKELQHLAGLVGLSLALTSQLVFALTPGQKLSETEIAKLGKLPEYNISGQHIRVIPSKQADSELTMLINKQGVVGSSRNEVAISNAETQQVQTLLKQLAPQPVSVKHFESTGIFVVRFADFNLAVQGQETIKAQMPNASVSLTVQFSKKVTY